MQVTCQFAIYPLGTAGLGPPLEAALEAVRQRGLTPVVGTMSSTVSGELGTVTDALRDAFAAAASGDCVLVATISNACE
jgi:uncharacterized protein YqgV (UPF0045/DUF77 family)